MTRALLLAGWLVLAAVPLGWWLVQRGRLDVWRSLPVPAALLDSQGRARSVTGPDLPAAITVDGGLPPRGRIARGRAPDGTPLAISGIRGGALVVALPRDPVTHRRDTLIGELGGRLAHDLAEPMQALFGHLDLIAREPLSDPGLESIAVCRRELERLRAAAADVLALNRLRVGGTPRTVRLAGVLAEEAAATFLAPAVRRDVRFRVEVPHERVAVLVAEGELLRALRNLVANALNHGLGPRRDVLVSVDADVDTVTFAVADSGPGLSHEQLQDLSRPLTSSTYVGPEGTGLGLAIVSEILAAHATALRVTERPGGGAVLSFELPRVP